MITKQQYEMSETFAFANRLQHFAGILSIAVASRLEYYALHTPLILGEGMPWQILTSTAPTM